MRDRSHDAADERGHDEEPDLMECDTTDDEGRSEASGRIDRGPSDGDPDEVDDGQTQSDDHAGGSGVRTLGRDAEKHEDEKRTQHDLGDEGPTCTDMNM